MAKHGEGLAKEIVKAVSNGEIQEPITRKKVEKLCKLKRFNYANDMKGVILSNSEIDANHSPTFKKYFKRISKGKYIVLPAYRNLQFKEQIINSRKDTHEKRLERLSKVESTKPEIQISTVASFKRNADVVVEILERANGKCENCKSDAPFVRKSDDTPYLEVHHKKSLSEGGEDTIENCIAVCPNCHSELHYGK